MNSAEGEIRQRENLVDAQPWAVMPRLESAPLSTRIDNILHIENNFSFENRFNAPAGERPSAGRHR